VNGKRLGCACLAMVLLAAGALCAVLAVWFLAGSRQSPRGAGRATQPGTAGGSLQMLGPSAIEREQAAERLFDEASAAADGRRWAAARERMSTLDEDYAHTDFYSIHGSTIAGLRDAIEAAAPAADAESGPAALYRAGVGTLRPLWAQRRYAEALEMARKLAAGELAASPEAGGWLVADAQALADFWGLVQTGAAALKAGEAITVAGIEGQFQKLDGDAVIVQREQASYVAKLATLTDDELIRLAERARKPQAGADHLMVALLRLHSAAPDVAETLAALQRAEQGGLDVARHRQLLEAPGPKMAAGLKLITRLRKGKQPVYTGEPLTIEAEEADLCYAPMRVAKSESASGNAFLWEPLEPGQEQFSEGDARAVYYVRAERECWVSIWARVRTPTNSANSFFLAVEAGKATNGRRRQWHFAPNRSWQWAAFDARGGADRAGRNPTPIQLKPGVNSIVIAVRERLTALDAIRIAPTASATGPHCRG